MAVPRFDEFMLPALRLAGDGQVHVMKETYSALADELGVSAEDRAITVPSGKQTRLRNRVQWAVTYLVKAGLLERPERGSFSVTDSGRGVLRDPPPKITKKWLGRFDSFQEFSEGTADEKETDHAPESDDRTPEEMVEWGVEQLDSDLADEILVQVKQCSPAFFEQLVIDVLVAMGYGGSYADAAKAVGKSGDGGIDGIINEDRLGLDVIYVQAKRWEGTVGQPVVQAFAGSLEGVKARKGVVITTSDFSQPAREFVRAIEKKIILIDGMTLARLMIEHGVGVTTAATYHVKQLDSDYFEPGL